MLTEPEPPQPKPFEGKWRRGDGTVVRIEGDKVVYEDGKQEQVTDLESQTLYTHRMTITKRWWFQERVVNGAGGQNEVDGRLMWDDGRVWVRTRLEDDEVMEDEWRKLGA